MPDDLKQEYRLLKSETRPQLWQFSGLALIFVLLVWMAYAGENEKNADLELLANPQIGDVYKYSISSNSYSLYKVTKVMGDSLRLSPNEYAVDHISGMNELLKTDSYLSSDEFNISKTDLLQWYEDEDIFGIIRK